MSLKGVDADAYRCRNDNNLWWLAAEAAVGLLQETMGLFAKDLCQRLIL